MMKFGLQQNKSIYFNNKIIIFKFYLDLIFEYEYLWFESDVISENKFETEV